RCRRQRVAHRDEPRGSPYQPRARQGRPRPARRGLRPRARALRPASPGARRALRRRERPRRLVPGVQVRLTAVLRTKTRVLVGFLSSEWGSTLWNTVTELFGGGRGAGSERQGG